MNKIALITDTHFGIKNDSKNCLEYSDKFLDEVFFPTLVKENIKIVIHAGDMLDRRRYVNFNTLNWVQERFINRLAELGIRLIVICGNHDVYYKNTNDVNSLDLLLSQYSNVEVHTNPQHLTIGETEFLLLPWMNDENRAKSFKMISKSEADVLVAHMGIVGFEMVKGVICEDGYTADMFSKFSKVLSGHFHLKSNMGNINYLGCPWELNFSDCNTPKGFYLMDTTTTEMEFIRNPYTMYKRFVYNDKSITRKDLLKSDALKSENVENRHVKLLVKYKKHPTWFNGFIDALYACNPLSLNVIDLFENEESGDQQEDVDLSLDTLEILNNSLEDYQDSLFDKLHRQRIIEVMGNLYMEAQDRE